MTRFLLTSTALVALSTAAQAQQADFNWTGWYVGGQVGLSQHQATYEDVLYDWYGHTMDFLSLSGSAGVQAGYNRVSGNRLNGIELDYNLLGNSEADIFASDVNVPNSANHIATLRARTGIVVDDTVIYATGGLAFADFDRSWTEYADVPDSWPDLGASKVGVALGFGIEHAINDRWTVRGEYTHTIFGENTSINPSDYALRINDDLHRLSFGVNYALGGSAGGMAQAAGHGTPADVSGAYVGALLGAGSADIATSDIDYDTHGGSYDVGNTGGLGGVTAGYNWQNGASVFGVEAQLAHTGLSAGYIDAFGPISTGIDHTASLRGRAGMIAGNTLMYVLGGVTVADVANQNFEDTSGTYTGLTVGAGVEQFLSGALSWTIESTFTRFDGGDDNHGELYHGSADLITVAAGLNYHLGAAGRAGGTGALAPSHDWSGAFYGVDIAALANQGSVWDQDHFEFAGQFDVISFGAGIGGHIGHNWQNGSFVYGAVADLAVFNNDRARTSPGYREVASAISAMGTVRGRAGIASGNSLFYLTGGVAMTRSTLTHAYLPAPHPDSFDLSDTRVGTVVGFGLEHALSQRSSIHVEALFSRFNPESYFNGDDCSGPVGFDGGACNMDGWDNSAQIRAGMSWRF